VSDTEEVTGRSLLEGVEAQRAAIYDDGRPEAVAKQHGLGKLTARERIDRLVDTGSFIEVGVFTEPAHETEFTRNVVAPADGVVTGSATIARRPVGLTVGDFTVLGGSMGLIGGLKIEQIGQQCMQDGHPLVMLFDGGGHRIQEALDSRHFSFGSSISLRWSTMSALSGWVPMVAAILGPGFAGPANYAAMSDLVVVVREIGTMGIAGPALVKIALGEDVTKESIGSADLQANDYGVVDLAVDSEEEALAAIERFLSYLPSNAGELPPIIEVGADDATDRRDEELLDLVPANTRRAYDVRRVLELVADRDSVFELKPGYARNIVTAFARLGGRPVGVIANQPMHRAGTIDTPACEKGAHFVSLCDAFGLPLVYFIDTPGILIGSAAEQSGLIRRHARMMYELGHATVPRLTVVLRKGYGVAYVMMNGGREFAPDLNIIWPTAEICGMQIEGAVDVVYRREVTQAEDPAAKRQELIDGFRAQVGPVQAASGFGVDDIVDPRDTRARLIHALERAAPRRRPTHPPKRHGISPI
jgi:acetyl-CoA carboxylase carboxyltransferase component